MTAQETLDKNLGGVTTAKAALDRVADAERHATQAVRTQTDRIASEQTAVREAAATANAKALAGEDVAALLAENATRQQAIDFFNQSTRAELEISVWKLTVEKLRLDYELATAILAAEQSRLAVHEQAVARALAALCAVCANPRLTVGGAKSQSEGRNTGDLKGQRHAQLIKDAAVRAEQAKQAWADAAEHTLNLQRAFLRRTA